jgi:hypothetical protein
MRTLIPVVVLTVLIATASHAALPQSLEEYQQRIQAQCTDPKATAKLFFEAVYVYLGGNKTLGEQLITEIVKDKNWKRTTSYFVTSMANQPYIYYSYAKGTSPENGYKMDPNNFELVFEGNVNYKPYADVEEGQAAKLFVRSSGADMPRPMTFERNRAGLYKVSEFSSICVGVRPPVVPIVYGEDIPESTDPVWVVREWLRGILLYHAGQKEEGLKRMNRLMTDPDPTLQTFHGAMDPGNAYIWRSYAKGTSPDNGYEVTDPLKIDISSYYQPGEEPTETSTSLRMFIRSSGADSARPIKLRKDSRGQWRIYEYSSLCVGVRKPKSPADGDF